MCLANSAISAIALPRRGTAHRRGTLGSRVLRRGSNRSRAVLADRLKHGLPRRGANRSRAFLRGSNRRRVWRWRRNRSRRWAVRCRCRCVPSRRYATPVLSVPSQAFRLPLTRGRFCRRVRCRFCGQHSASQRRSCRTLPLLLPQHFAAKNASINTRRCTVSAACHRPTLATMLRSFSYRVSILQRLRVNS